MQAEEKAKISSVVELLNKVLQMDREGISRHFASSTVVDIRIAETPLELIYNGDDKHAPMPVIGMLNGITRLLTNHRIITVMRNAYVIERFEAVYCGDEHASEH